MSYTLNYRGAKIDELLGQVDEQFIAEYNVSLYADITAAIAAGKQVLLKKDNALYPYIGTDASSSYTFAMVDEDAILQLFTVSTASVWATVSKALQEELTFDAAPTDGSTNPVTSDGIYDAIEEAKSEIATSDQPGMTVGASDNLISDAKISNNSPYLYRPVLNGVGNRAYSKLIGATIANNQLGGNLSPSSVTVNGIAITTTTSNFTLTGGTSGGSAAQRDMKNVNVTANHKYFVGGGFVQLYTSGGGFVANINSTDTSTWGDTLYMPSTDGYFRFSAYIKANTVYQAATYTPHLTDLTAMFGSTIADYAYTLEQGQAGAGIAWLKSYGFFGKYAPYDAGSLISTKAEGKRVTGRNLFDSSTATILAAYFDGNNIVANGNNACSYMPCKPNTTYTIQRKRISGDGASTLVLGYTNGNTPPTGGSVCLDNQSVSISSGATANVSITTSADATYLVFYLGRSGYAAETIETVQIELGSTAHAYEDYITPKTYDLGSDELQGLFKLDANNNIVADGDIKTPDGQITRKYGIVDLGTLEWALYVYGGINGFYSGDIASLIKRSTNNAIPSNILAPIYANVADAVFNSDGIDKEITISASGTANIKIKNNAYSDAAAFKTAMSGQYLVYELATPTTEQGIPFIDPSIVYPNGTEEYIDTRSVPVPVGNETEYTEDLKGGLETILDTPPANGTYVLKATVSGGVATLSWVSE